VPTEIEATLTRWAMALVNRDGDLPDLWCNGIRGCGKTTALRALVAHLESASVACGYFDARKVALLTESAKRQFEHQAERDSTWARMANVHVLMLDDLTAGFPSDNADLWARLGLLLDDRRDRGLRTVVADNNTLRWATGTKADAKPGDTLPIANLDPRIASRLREFLPVAWSGEHNRDHRAPAAHWSNQ
jgi:hypothetical protein